MTKYELYLKTQGLRAKIEQASAWTDDADALEMVELFPHWVEGKDVIVGERVQDDGILYKCVQPHTTQADWRPALTPALWVRVSVDEFPEWVQPQGSADAYRIGDKVTHAESRWISFVDANVWEPGVYGWSLYTP